LRKKIKETREAFTRYFRIFSDKTEEAKNQTKGALHSGKDTAETFAERFKNFERNMIKNPQILLIPASGLVAALLFRRSMVRMVLGTTVAVVGSCIVLYPKQTTDFAKRNYNRLNDYFKELRNKH